MAQTRDSLFGPSSPHSSSGGAESFKGTPDTRLTAFSSSDSSAKSARLLQGICRSASTTPPVKSLSRGYLNSASQLDKDPFVSPGHRTGLSPTASSFQPFSQPTFVPPTLPGSIVASALSNDLGASRVVSICGLVAISPSQVESWLQELEDRGVCFHSRKSIQQAGDVVYVQFSDIRDACAIHASSRLTTEDWRLEFSHPKAFPKNDFAQQDCQINGLGQVQIVAVSERSSSVDVFQTIELVKNFLHPYGQLFAFIVLSTCQDGSFRAVAEFCNVNSAVTAAGGRRNRHVLNGIHVEISLRDPDSLSTSEVTRALQAVSFGTNDDGSLQRRPDTSIASLPVTTTGAQYSPAVAMYPVMLQSPFNPNMSVLVDRYPNPAQGNALVSPISPSYQMIGSLYQTPPSPALTTSNNQSPSRSMPIYGRSDARRQNATRVNRSPHNNAASHHNHVDIHRIREGIDVRTTIMLRNIPNKVDQAMLKRIVDESSWGKYDFMYLRIDFANDCNVGYAFINFVDPLDIIDFVDARGNQRWNCFKSDKVAEISYATIQGKDCLVQKFRNSSVMLEAPHYRPKLYFTSNGPMPEFAGQEEPFPDPDNQSKMKRSCENAEHVGLFTPNAGQHFRDEQRRRRSQYDRGTRLAALEEHDYEAAVQQQIFVPES